MIEIAIGLIGLCIAIYEHLKSRKWNKDLKFILSEYEEKTKFDRELLKKIAENTERYNDLLPLVKHSVQSDSKIEDYIFKQPRISDLLNETSNLKTYKVSDLLNEDVFVAGRPVKISDLLEIEILKPPQ